MRSLLPRHGATTAGLALVAGCSLSPRGSFDSVRELAEPRVQAELAWTQAGDEPASAETRVRALLQAPLTCDGAVQISLLRNPALLATFEDLGIAQADLVQAGMLGNPVFSASARWPDAAAGGANLEFGLMQPLMDLLVMPLRRSLAREQVRQAQFLVAQAVLETARDARVAFVNLQAAQETVELRRQMQLAADLTADFARRQRAAGNISELVMTEHIARTHDAHMDLIAAEGALIQASEELTRTLGLAEGESWRVEETLSDPPDDPPLEGLEALALANRLDLLAARQGVEIHRRAARIERLSPFLNVDAGADTERDTDGAWLTGPNVEVQIPLFDWGRARVARARAEQRQAELHTAALEARARSEVRERFALMRGAREAAEYARSVALPLQERLTALGQLHYNAMILGVYDLLLLKTDELQASLDLVNARRDLWTARANLTLAAGGLLPASADSSSSEAMP